MSKIEKLFYESIKKPVWIQEKQHKRGVRTPTTYRYGKHWEGSSGMSMTLLKKYRNRGIDIEAVLRGEVQVAGIQVY